jgi:hypothetical protein
MFQVQWLHGVEWDVKLNKEGQYVWIWKESVVIYFKALISRLPEDARTTTKILSH